MPLLYEYAITPDVFDASSYAHEDVGTARLEYLKDVFLEEALLRNLRSGEWLLQFRDTARPWHRRGLEMLKKMAKQNRFRRAAAALPHSPQNDADWCREAVASHQLDPLTGIIATSPVLDEVEATPMLGRIDRLGGAPCWASRSPSVRLNRSPGDYESQIRLIMNCAKSIMFIDPHLDPSLPRYDGVLPLMCLAKGRTPKPLIEIHRVIYVGSGRSRNIVQPEEWERRFREAWTHGLSGAGLKVDVFIWDDHHDRYLITDIIGILMGNGFDTSPNPKHMTTWSRLGRGERDDIQREFDPAAKRHKLRYRFTIP